MLNKHSVPWYTPPTLHASAFWLQPITRTPVWNFPHVLYQCSKSFRFLIFRLEWFSLWFEIKSKLFKELRLLVSELACEPLKANQKGSRQKVSSSPESCKRVVLGVQPYHLDCFQFGLILEAKQGQSWLVVDWETEVAGKTMAPSAEERGWKVQLTCVLLENILETPYVKHFWFYNPRGFRKHTSIFKSSAQFPW